MSLEVEHLPLLLRPTPARTVLRPFMPADTVLAGHPSSEHRDRVIDRVLAMSIEQVVGESRRLTERVRARHADVESVFDERFKQIAELEPGLVGLTLERCRLIGAYFTEEYAFEAAALFNPCLVPHPDQASLPDGALRIILSLRAVGEGHVSSVIFRTGLITKEGGVAIDPPAANPIDARVDRQREGGLRLLCPAVGDLSGVVLFPASREHRHGIEDLRLTRFTDDAGATYVGTLTGVGSEAIRQEVLRTDDFRSFELRPITGPFLASKGMAFFPRRIAGRYVILGRQDHERIWVLFSDDLYTWDDGTPVIAPATPWEAVQLGNCGSPIELAEGWLVLTHGVGAMRSYSIGACLLDKADPTKVLGRLRRPLIEPGVRQWTGYVPGIVYSCGGLVHRRWLYLPYGVADSFATMARVRVDALLSAMTSR